jgi:hypothetical protein
MTWPEQIASEAADPQGEFLDQAGGEPIGGDIGKLSTDLLS